MSQSNSEVLETVEVLCTLAKVQLADIAHAIDLQPGTLRRTLAGNPTVSKLKNVAWAIGCPHRWLLWPAEHIRVSGKSMVRIDPWSPAFEQKVLRKENATNLKFKAMNSSTDPHDPTDKEMLSKMYPAAAITGDVMNTEYMDITEITVDLTSRLKDWANMPFSKRKYYREKLGEGLPKGYRLTDQALRNNVWHADLVKKKLTIEQMVEQGFVAIKR
jgi:hypothetical protein